MSIATAYANAQSITGMEVHSIQFTTFLLESRLDKLINQGIFFSSSFLYHGSLIKIGIPNQIYLPSPI